MNDFSEVIASLNLDDPRSNITNIKAAVKDRLEATDPNVFIDVTDHFNHSYVPDLILSWKNSSERRDVFLRTGYREMDLRQDIVELGSQKPILLSLAVVPNAESTAIQEQARESNSLVVDPYGLQEFSKQSPDKPVVSLLSHAVLQGGRGVIDTATIRESGSSVDAGFAAARAGEASATSAAVAMAAAILDTSRALQINRLLHAVWLGSGQPGSAFPGAPGITATLDAESLRFILQLESIDDSSFWHRLGSGLTLERLCELGDFPESVNLQRLLRGTAYKLQARGCRLLQSSQLIESARWSVRSGLLVLAVGTDDLHFAPRTLAELPTAQKEYQPISLGVLQARAQRSAIKLGEVKLSDGTHTLAYSSESEDADVAQVSELASLQSLIPSAALISATAHVGTKELQCSFTTRSVRGNGPARFLLSDLTQVAMPLLTSAEPDRVADIEALMESPISATGADQEK